MLDIALKPQARMALKAVTDATHQALHHHPVSLGIIQQGRVDALDQMLAAQRDCLIWLEAHRDLQGLPCQIGTGPLLTLLHADVGVGAPVAGPALQGAAGYDGAAYVMLGALMGRKVMRQRIPQAQSHYLHAPFPAPQWHSLLQRLSLWQDDPATWVDCLAGAKAAFALMRLRLDAHHAAAQRRP